MTKKIIFLFLLFVLMLLVVSCNNPTSSPSSAHHLAQETTVKKLIIIDEALGKGQAASKNSQVAIHYSGWLYDDSAENKKGALFDTSHDLGDPLVFQLGKQRVIKGWEMGIIGMKVGGKRTLVIPSELAYGSKRIGTARTAIPANSALVFDVEMVDLQIEN